MCDDSIVQLFPGLNRTNDVDFVMNSTSVTSRLATDQRLIHLDRPISTDPVLVGVNHAGSQFVRQLKGRLVAANAELPLKRMLRTKVLSRRMLAGGGCRGPAIIQEYDTAVVVPPGWSAALDDHANILMERQA